MHKHNMTYPILQNAPAEVVDSFIAKLHFSISKGLPHSIPPSSLRIDEQELVRDVLQMLQGFCSSVIYWDDKIQGFRSKDGIFVSHLTQTSLKGILNLFLFAGTCLKRVELFVIKVHLSGPGVPTLSAFASSVSLWLTRLRELALQEEEKLFNSDDSTTSTLLRLTNSVSSLLAGAEFLWQVVSAAVPSNHIDSNVSVPASEMATHIIDHLFKKLNEVCLVQDGQGGLYHMLLAIFTGSLLPYLQVLDSWLYDGILDDPFEEMFFCSNAAVSIDQPVFWEMSYLLRARTNPAPSVGLISSDKETSLRIEKIQQESTVPAGFGKNSNQDVLDNIVCPLFLKDFARAVVSAGKSLQLVQHVQDEYRTQSFIDKDFDQVQFCPETSNSVKFGDRSLGRQDFPQEASFNLHQSNARVLGVLTLSEIFLLSLAGLLDNGDCVYGYLRTSPTNIEEISQKIQAPRIHEKAWLQFLSNAILWRRHEDVDKKLPFESATRDQESPVHYLPINPVINLCKELLSGNRASRNELNVSKTFHLPQLDDEKLREAIFGAEYSYARTSVDPQTKKLPRLEGTDYRFGFQFGNQEYQRLADDERTIETLFAFPTLLPYFKEDVPLSEILPSQKDSTLASRILKFIQSIKLKDLPQPTVIIQECLAVYIKRQVIHIGKLILLKLMGDWRLMDELFVLRAIYLLGSGDILQQFLTVIFNRLDKGDSLDDDFELNTILQESIRNSTDRSLLTAPNSLVVSITKNNACDDEIESTPSSTRGHFFGIDSLDMLNFTYKVSWPLDLIVNTEALKKYNQVMGFLLKVKHAKFVLDKTRKWMWKGRSRAAYNYKRHLLLEQKLLHFVDAFHQYVMDQVYHSAWTELCSGMATAASLDEVMEVHEGYLASIQRQCFVAHDKLWALIASRVKTILALALDFYNVQQTLGSGGAAPAIKARCEMEIDRIEKQFGDCIAFLLRILSFKLNVGHFPHLADLVTRINYNHFYMSDSGSLLTTPGYESCGKLGKTPALKV